MKVCIVSHFQDELDEGVRIVGKNILEHLKKTKIKTLEVDISSIFNYKSMKKIREFNPDIIHFVLTPTIWGIIISKLSTFFYGSKIVISAIHPSIPKLKLLKSFKPDLILVQSQDSKKIFNAIGFKTEFLPNSVDLDQFEAVNSIIKGKLRNKYKIPTDKFVILHLASITRERNLNVFKELQKIEHNQVIIVGRENENIDKDLIIELKENGCIVWIKHFQNIEEVYKLADCYVFPTINKKACIETPLSVLEAMACNLPVITTKFGALPDLFNESDGLFFINEESDISEFIDIIKNEELKIKTREKIYLYSSENIVNKLMNIYEGLL